jgi:hypothetical protein
MKIFSQDKQVDLALARAIGHTEPYTVEELVRISQLIIHNARNISVLANCTQLVSLVLVGCEIDDLEPIKDLRRLTTLEVKYSSLHDIEALRDLEQIMILFLPCNRIETITALLGLSQLSMLSLVGNPLSPHSYYEVLPRIPMALPEPFFPGEKEFSAEEEWQLTLELQQRGMPACYYRRDGQYYLCIPGLSITSQPETGHARLNPGQLRAELAKPDPDLLTIYRTYQPHLSADRTPKPPSAS